MWMDFLRRHRRRKSSSSRREHNRRKQRNRQRQLLAEPLEDRRLLTVIGYLADLAPPQGFVLNSVIPQDQAGKSVSSAGDVNHDGFDDLLVGFMKLVVDDGQNSVRSEEPDDYEKQLPRQRARFKCDRVADWPAGQLCCSHSCARRQSCFPPIGTDSAIP